MKETPQSLGYRMPAEWERHKATWLSWPKDPGTFPGDTLRLVEGTYAEIVRQLQEGEEVRIMINDEETARRVKELIGGSGNISFHVLKTVDVWVRDYGPIYLDGMSGALTKWKFNAWGMKYDDLLLDDQAGDEMATRSGLKTFRPGMVLEGGSIDSNGKGTLMTTEQCLLNKNRNPLLKREEIEDHLKRFLGAAKVVWLKRGIEGDDTDGHVDDIARFVGPRKVLVAHEENHEDPNSGILEEDAEILSSATDQDGREFEIHNLPMPPTVDSSWGRLPASYANFYVGNSCVLVPTFGGKSDAAAASIVEEAFPEREVVGVDCRALVYGLGTIHCVTQQVPTG